VWTPLVGMGAVAGLVEGRCFAHVHLVGKVPNVRLTLMIVSTMPARMGDSAGTGQQGTAAPVYQAGEASTARNHLFRHHHQEHPLRTTVPSASMERDAPTLP